jgi:hypothetical protein
MRLPDRSTEQARRQRVRNSTIGVLKNTKVKTIGVILRISTLINFEPFLRDNCLPPNFPDTAASQGKEQLRGIVKHCCCQTVVLRNYARNGAACHRSGRPFKGLGSAIAKLAIVSVHSIL